MQRGALVCIIGLIACATAGGCAESDYESRELVDVSAFPARPNCPSLLKRHGPGCYVLSRLEEGKGEATLQATVLDKEEVGFHQLENGTVVAIVGDRGTILPNGSYVWRQERVHSTIIEGIGKDLRTIFIDTPVLLVLMVIYGLQGQKMHS